jgi:hypothetical protein
MELNPELTFWDGLIITGGGIVCLLLSIFHGIKAWTSSSEEFVILSKSERPKSWRKWPIYNWLGRT